jgi:DnaJ-class molecular chaperone
MAENPYSVLGVSPKASADDVRRAYLKLVKELHPDVNPDTAAEDRFKKISAAYDIIGDSEKRAAFDRGEIDASGEPVRQAWQGAGGPRSRQHYSQHAGAGPFDDFFSDVFSRGYDTAEGFARRGRDLRYTLEVTFLEAATGAKKRVTLPEGGALDLSVPAGVNDGQVLRLKGKGAPGIGSGGRGDALVEIKVGQHPQFNRSGLDIQLEVPVTLDEAVLGAKIAVPTISSRVNLQIPAGTSSGKTFRLRQQGINPAGGRPAGDQLVTVRIVLPDTLDDDLKTFMEDWRTKHGYESGRS